MILLQTQSDSWLSAFPLMNFLQASALLLIGFPLVFLLSKWLRSAVSARFSPGQGLLVGKGVFWGCFGVLAMMVLQQLGFQLTALLATLGIGGVALAFAAQTSVSNVISGLFILLENSFSIGDFIKIGDVTGEVVSIDLMSVKVRTFDNKFVRVPNESLVKSVVTNFSKFPIRRVEINVSVAYREDLERVRSVLLDVASKNQLALAEPAAFVSFEKFADSSVEIFFAVWAQRTDFFAVRSSLMIEIKKRFEEECIQIPFPQVVVNRPDDAEVEQSPSKDEEAGRQQAMECAEKRRKTRGGKKKG